ncbi:MAG TPA: carboxypeptidase-like regulatory domain-containing protein, partial [Phnomibacter sp.]|nr:carboxypeptidase-like regulatory domain-containing protein [Phnomibacter sp.]
MKLIMVLLLAGLLQAYAEGNAQQITYSGKNVGILQVFKVIEDQTGYSVFANKELLKGVSPVTVKAEKMPLKEFLDHALRDQPIGYEILSKTIFIKAKEVPQTSVPSVTTIQDEEVVVPRDISGTVVSADGEPLAGATIVVKGTRISTSSGPDGQFVIAADPGQVLIITYVGYQSLEVNVDTRTTYQITLERVEQVMDQVVVTAMGITRRAKTISYNVQEIKGDDISNVDNGNFVNSLIGKVAGATINSSSAGNGASARVVMRGVKSISGNNNALYVIDGIPMPNNIRGQAEDIFSGAGQTGDFVANLNPEDIESLSILSGPSAAAMYGSAAANGVVLITTKKGAKNKTQVSVSNTTSFTSPMILPRFQNTYGVTETGSYQSWGDKLQTPGSYSPSDFFQTGVNNNTALTFSTGTDKSQTYISVGNVHSKGIVPNNNFNRSNFTARNTSSFMDGKMELDVSFMAGLIDERNMISQGQYFNPLVAVYLFPPGDDFNRARAYERHDPSRNLMTQFWPYGDNGLMMQNPFWVTQRTLFDNQKERYMTTVSLRYKLADGISLSGRAKLDKSN